MRRQTDLPPRRITAVLGGLVAVGLTLALLAAPTGAESAQYPPTTTPTSQPGSTTTVTPPRNTTTTTTNGSTTTTGSGSSVLVVTATRGGGRLPITGGDILGMTVIGAVVLGAGVGLVLYRRHIADRDSTSPAPPTS